MESPSQMTWRRMSDCSVRKTCWEKASGKAGKSGKGEVFCKSTWAGKEPLWWRQGQMQTGALWIQDRQGKMWVSMKPLGCQYQCQCLQLTAVRLFTHTHSHWSPWWLRPLQQKEWDKEEGREATSLLCRRDNLGWLWQKTSTFGISAADVAALGGWALWWVRQPKL